MVATVLGQRSGTSQSCALCLGSDHLKEDCALSALEVAKQGVIPQAQRLHPGLQALGWVAASWNSLSLVVAQLIACNAQCARLAQAQVHANRRKL